MNLNTRSASILASALFSLVLVPQLSSNGIMAQTEPVPRRPDPGITPADEGSIVGRVVLPSGQPISKAVRIKLGTTNDPGLSLYTDNRGEFSFRNLREGTYYVEAEADAQLYEPTIEQVRLPRGARVNLTIHLKPKTEERVTKPGGDVVSMAELDQKVPGRARKEFEKATRLVAEGKLLESIECFKKAIALYPAYVMARNDLGVQYLKLKQMSEATEQFEAAIAVDSRVFYPRLNLSIVLIEQRRFGEAKDHLFQAVSIDSSSPAVRLYLGIAAVETDELHTAERELKTALSMGGSEYSIAHFHLAKVYMKRGERNPAIRELREYLNKAPGGEHANRARELIEELSRS